MKPLIISLHLVRTFNSSQPYPSHDHLNAMRGYRSIYQLFPLKDSLQKMCLHCYAPENLKSLSKPPEISTKIQINF